MRMSADTLIAEAAKLSAADRLKIAQALWQSAWDEQGDIPLTAEQRAELDCRLADFEANPNEGSSWEESRRRLEGEL
jgi:putative addiction module component (TIGR02574 family)